MLCSQEPAGRTQQVRRSPSAWLKAPSSSPLLCGPQWLLSAHSIFATSSHSSASWVEQSEGHMEESIGKLMQRPLSSWGTSRELRHKAHCGMQRILFTSCPLAELQSEHLHTHMLPTASTWTRDHQQKWLQTKAK